MGHKLEDIVHLPTPSFARPAGHVSCDLSPATVKGQAKGKAKGTETTAGFTLRVTEFNRVGNTNVGRIRKFLATEGCPEPSEITFVGRASRSKMPMWCSVPKFSTLPGKPAFGTDCIQRKSRSQRLCSGMGLAFWFPRNLTFCTSSGMDDFISILDERFSRWKYTQIVW